MRSPSDKMLDRYGFPGPVTPQVPQNRVRQTYRGQPPCPPCEAARLAGLMSGSFAGGIGMSLGGLGKGGGHGGGHHHHGGGGRGWGGRGGYWGGWGGDTYIVQETAPCPYGYVWDAVNLRCARIDMRAFRGLGGLGSTATDVCTGLRAGIPIATQLARLCASITDPTARTACAQSFAVATAAAQSICTEVDAAAVREAARQAAALSAATYIPPPPATYEASQPKAASSNTVPLVAGAVGIGLLAWLVLA